MKEPAFVDTGYWIALFDRRDHYHTATKELLPRLLGSYRVVLSDFVLFETLTYLNCSVGRHDLAVRFLDKVAAGGFDVVEVGRPVKERALALFRQYADKDFSVTDCCSFVVMRDAAISRFAGFDAHFEQMGFVSLLHRS